MVAFALRADGWYLRQDIIGDRRENPGFQSGDERRLSVTN